MLAIDLQKQEAVDFDTKATEQISFTGNLCGEVFYYWKSERKHLSQGILKVYQFYFVLI